MVKKYVLVAALFIAGTIVLFNFIAPLQAALETQLLVDVSGSPDNAPYKQTQWYGFLATANKGYCAILSPSTGNADAYLFDNSFNLRGSSKNTGLTADKVWYGDTLGGVFHVGVYGTANPSSNYGIQVSTAPYAKTISPTSGSAGTLVTITGLGFGDTQGSNYVNFGTVKASSYTSWTKTQIKVYVPSGVASGVIQVAVYVASKASNPMNFTASGATSNGTMFRYDLERTGNYPNGPTALPLNMKWSYYTNWASSIASTIANNIVYLALDKLYALDANTGVLKWSYPLAWSCPPAVAGGVVYCANSDASKYCTFYAIDANTGSLKWKYQDLSSSTDYQKNRIFSTPAVFNGVAYFSSLSKFYAVDANSGSLRWSYSLPAGESGDMSFTISNGVIYFVTGTTTGQKIYAIYANNGLVKWTSTPGTTQVGSRPAIANGTIYFGGGDRVCAFDVNTGVLKWKSTIDGGILNSPAVSNGVVYICCASPQSTHMDTLYAFDANTGVLKWTSIGSLTPIISNSLVYTASYNGNFYALDANNGSVKWSYAIGGLETNWPFRDHSAAAYNGKVYVHGANGYFYCFGQ